MSEETPETNAIDDYTHNKLKDVSTTAIEGAIIKALSELIGVEYGCSIDEISYGDRMSKGGKFNVNIWEKFEYLDRLGVLTGAFGINRVDVQTRIDSLGENSRMIVDVLQSEDRGFTSEEISVKTRLNKYIVEKILSELYKDGLVSVDRSTGEIQYTVSTG